VLLREIPFRLSYCTGGDDLVGGFLVPCLEASSLYRRAAGYFTSAGLALAARGVASLASRGGTMRLIVSPHLEPDDVEAIQASLDDPEAALRCISSRNLDEIEDAILTDRLNALAWLSAAKRLEVKLALRVDGEGKVSRGLYHEKIGIFSDESDAHVAFTGSSNETAGGLIENFESIDVFTSWNDSEGRVAAKIAHFESLWANQSSGVRVIEFSDASRELLEKFRDPEKRLAGIDLDRVGEPIEEAPFRAPRSFELRDYQAAAIRAWSAAGGKGIFAMATGSGKTLTALTLASKVAEKNSPFVLIVVCPYINLCKQWMREMAGFNLSPVACYEGRQRWESLLDEGYQRITAGLTKVHSLVVSNSTFQSPVFQAHLRQHLGKAHHLIVADEVHNLGAEKVQQCLPDSITLRLGLSATPERHHDPEGTQVLLDYFGPIIYTYSIDKAIADGRLSSYRYYPHLVSLTESEAEEYAEITARLGRILAGAEENAELGQAAMRLLIRRARILGAAANKLEVLDQVVASLPERPKKAIFYCGDGKTKDSVTDEETRQIREVARLLGEKHGLRVRNFTYEESPAEREEILRDLSSGFLDAVVAIRCLDEGIDLPDLRMGFLLASSTNPRQFVQRRGRLLRHAPGKDRAIIHDFIIQPPDLGGQLDDDAFNLERSFFERELKRIAEFCRTAENGPEALTSLSDIRNSFNLLGK